MPFLCSGPQTDIMVDGVMGSRVSSSLSIGLTGKLPHCASWWESTGILFRFLWSAASSPTSLHEHTWARTGMQKTGGVGPSPPAMKGQFTHSGRCKPERHQAYGAFERISWLKWN